MGIFKYPYTDLHELNLDMILYMIKELDHEMDDFVAANKITNAGAWDITKQYQAWTVVSDNNVGYISLKPVPVGIAITNTEYWGVIADYNILITDLSSRVSDLETAVTSLDASVTSLNNRLHKRKFIVISDSYGTVPNPDGRTFIEQAFHTMNVSASDYYYATHGGSGFVHTNDNIKFIDLLDNLNVPDPNEITDIIVFGGANDIEENVTDIEYAIQDFVDDAKTRYPKAFVAIGHPGVSWNTNGGRSKRFESSLGAYRSCNERGAAYIANSEFTLYNSALMASGDNAHPNALGVNELAAQLVNYIISGVCDVHYVNTDTPTYSLTGTMTFNGYGFSLDNNRVTPLTLSGGDFITVSGTNINFPKQGAAPDLFDFAAGFLCYDSVKVIEGFTCSLYYVDDNNISYTCPGFMYASSYDNVTHHVKYGLSVYSSTDIRSISSLKRCSVCMPNPSILI